MEKQNYQKQLEKILSSIKVQNFEQNKKPTLLLHACCAPCSSYVLEYLLEFFDISIFYYNPNIHPQTEYKRRLEELKTFLSSFNAKSKIPLLEQLYDTKDFFTAVNTENEPELKTEQEKGERCRRCYQFRLKKTYDYALKNSFDWFVTTLSISPFKDAQKINEIGKQLEFENSLGPKFLTSDFKKKGGFKRSLELSKKYNLYRQDYCGCIFSKQNMHKNNQDTDN